MTREPIETINILTGEIKQGAWKYDPRDPRNMIPLK